MKQLAIRTRAPHTLSITIFEVQGKAWTLWAWRSQLTLPFKPIGFNGASEVPREGTAWPISHYAPNLCSNQFLRLQPSPGAFRAPGLTECACSLRRCIMLSYLIVPFSPSVHQNRKLSAFGWHAPWHRGIKHLGDILFLSELTCAVGVRCRLHLSAPKISISWKYSC